MSNMVAHSRPTPIALVRLLAVIVLPVISAIPLSSSAVAAASIEWEIVNRFPFFKDEFFFTTLADIYAQLPEAQRRDEPVIALERQMEDLAARRELPDIFGPKDLVEHSGWTSSLVEHTCFDEAKSGHRGCMLNNDENFIDQRKTTAIAWLKEAPKGQSCEWLVNGNTIGSGACEGKMKLPPIEFEQNFALSVKANGQEIARSDAQKAHRAVIVGMGDSFAAGEGNPDRPVQFVDKHNNYNGSSPKRSGYRLYPLSEGTVPGRGGSLGVKAKWLNEQCHRSLYSHQLRAALQIALEQPQVSVTYLGYACTGAAVQEGLVGQWGARSDPAVGRDDSSQIVKALRDLCADRTNAYDWPNRTNAAAEIRRCQRLRHPINVLLVSVGGNDVGFASVIAREAINSSGVPWYYIFRKARYDLWLKAVGPISFETAIARQGNLPRLYRLFRKTLQTSGLKPGQIIQTGYPQLMKTAAGSCAKSNAGMDVHAILGTRSRTGERAVSFVSDFNQRIEKSTPAIAGTPPVTVVHDFAEGFAGHSLCDGDGRPGDNMVFPDYDLVRHAWSPYAPWTWRAYRPRQRWFVTPNDAFLTGHYMRTKAGSGGDPDTVGIAQPLLAATLSGAFHPNALGQAAIGDGLMKALRDKLDLHLPATAPQ